jgi:hypothetical protein
MNPHHFSERGGKKKRPKRHRALLSRLSIKDGPHGYCDRPRLLCKLLRFRRKNRAYTEVTGDERGTALIRLGPISVPDLPPRGGLGSSPGEAYDEATAPDWGYLVTLMPDPDRLLRTLQQARQAFLTTPGRQGRLVRLQPVEEVLVAGDLHGNVDNFRRILLKADLAKHPHRHLVLQELVHGPFHYPDGSDKSHQLVDLLAALKCQFPARVHLLLGNHELAQWTNQWIAKADTDLNDLFRTGVEFAYVGRAAQVYAAYLELFATVPLAVRTPNRVFLSHSLPSAKRLDGFDPARLTEDLADEKDLQPGGFVHALVWGRDTQSPAVQAFLQKVDADLLITGHIPCERGFDVPNDRQLILDCLGTPACYCLFPANRPLSHQELVSCVQCL